MDQTLVASIRKRLKATPTAELRQAFESGEKANRSPEELEAMRELLDERRTKSKKAAVALAAAILMGTLVGGGAWWQDFPAVITLLAGVGGAILGFASCYTPDLFGRA